MGINQFDPDPDPHFQFLCEHGARLHQVRVLLSIHHFCNNPVTLPLLSSFIRVHSQSFKFISDSMSVVFESLQQLSLFLLQQVWVYTVCLFWVKVEDILQLLLKLLDEGYNNTHTNKIWLPTCSANRRVKSLFISC